jgi:hypothetical protein
MPPANLKARLPELSFSSLPPITNRMIKTNDLFRHVFGEKTIIPAIRRIA